MAKDRGSTTHTTQRRNRKMAQLSVPSLNNSLLQVNDECSMTLQQPQNSSVSSSTLPGNPLMGRPRRTRSSRAMGFAAITTYCYYSCLFSTTTEAFSAQAPYFHKLSSSSTSPRRGDALDAARTSAKQRQPTENVLMVPPVAPRSKRVREQAVQAMDRKLAQEGSLHLKDNVDAQMLELLSDQFLYPPQKQKQQRDMLNENHRPRGRPKSVPGAMKLETLIKFHEQDGITTREDVDISSSTTIQPYASTTIGSTPREVGSHELTAARAVASTANGITKKGGRGVKRSVHHEKPTTPAGEPRTRRAPKVLPSKKQDETVASGTKQQQPVYANRRNSHNNNVDLQRFFRTELLTAEEEYSLGMKVYFMTKCEEVHEGLCEELERLPSMEEWGRACGYTDDDPLFVEVEGDVQLRPAGSDAMFEQSDPNRFVGNGLATEAGPGRGRGRVKQPAPVKLDDFYDDTEVRFIHGKATLKGASQDRSGRIVNRGTPTDFVETMLEARQAKQRMVQSNMRLVVSIARKYSNVGVNLQDLVQEGSLGLTRAAEKFEPTKGFKFSTYASWWIQQAVFRSIAYHSRTIRLPVHVHNLLNRVRRIRTSLEQELGRVPTNEEMADQLDMSVEKYNKMMRLTRRSISLELPKYKSNPKDLGHESADLLGDTIASSNLLQDDSSPEKRVDRGLFHEDLSEMLQILEENERRVICARYGLADGLTRTVTTVAVQMKQTKAWVRSQECRALRKLRRPWYEKRLKEHQDSLTS